MPAEWIDGTAVANGMLDALKPSIDMLEARGTPPHLAAIRANEDAGSAWYAKAQEKHCQTHGVRYTLDNLGADADEAAIRRAIDRHNADPSVSAILLHMPLPPGASHLRLAAAIAPEKDAEGIHPVNLGTLLATGTSDPAPCTAMSAVELLRRIRPQMKGAKALVVGRSAIVGKPAALLLLNLNATVMIAHSHSDIPTLAKEADVIIAATGASAVAWERYKRARVLHASGQGEKPALPDLRPLIRGGMVKPGAILIDVGVNEIPKALDDNGDPVCNEKGRPVMIYAGDIDCESVQDVASHVTSPKGGTGPVTNAFLLRNTVHAAMRQAGLPLEG